MQSFTARNAEDVGRAVVLDMERMHQSGYVSELGRADLVMDLDECEGKARINHNTALKSILKGSKLQLF